MRMEQFVRATRSIALLSVFGAGHALANISGNVFQDFNSNGVKDTATTAAVDLGLQSVTVTATCVTGLGPDGVYGTADDVRTTYTAATTLANGDYTIATTTPAPLAGTAANPACRVSFSWDAASAVVAGAPNPLYGMTPAFVGTGSNTATQFVNDGATNVNLGLNYPPDFCQNVPTLVTNCMRYGASNDATNGPRTALNGFPYTASGNAVTPTAFALNNQLGSTWGLAYHKAQKKVLVSAYLKRNIGLGTGGLGQIYAVDASNTTTPTQTVTNFLNLEVLKPGSAGPNPRVSPVPAPGASPTDPVGVNYAQDFGVAVSGDLKTGKLGIGDIDFSDDQTTLYAIGLNSRKLYIIPVGAGLAAPAASAITEVALPDPGTGATGCPADAATPGGELNLNLRPFALKSHKGSLYVGLTCTGESTTVNTDLRAFVYRYNGGTSFTQVANTTLNYNLESGLAWNRWRDTADTGFSGCCFQVPEPLLSDIEFAPSGDMLLGIRDRMGDATGRGNFALNGGTTVDGRAHGDLIRACFGASGSASPGLYDADNCTPNGRAYSTDTFPDPNNPMGGLTQVPGFTEVVTTSKDPVRIYSSGVAWYTNNTAGTGTRGYEIMANSGSAGDVGSKASQMGDLEALCDAAPIQIGNRVWFDSNANGIQDPGEPPIQDVFVRLYDSGGTLLATAKTDANGNYYFSNRQFDENGNLIVNPPQVTSSVFGVGFTPNTNGYQIRFDEPTNYGGSGELAGFQLTNPNASGDTSNNPLADLTDSDAVLPTPSNPPGSGNYPFITFNTGGPGENNFGLDAGFTQTYSLGNRVWYDTNNDGILGPSETPIADALVRLTDGAGNQLYVTPSGAITNVAAGNAIAQVITDSNGYYRFDGLPAGDYRAVVDSKNWTGFTGSYPTGTLNGGAAGFSATQTPLAGYASSTPGTNGVTGVTTGTGSTNNNDKGENPATPALYTTAGVRSGIVTLGPNNQPTNDTDTVTTSASGNGPSGNGGDNLAVDFGFFRLTVGDTLWYDNGAGGGTRNDGLKNGTEPGLPAGVVVELLKGGVVVASTTTDANGNYVFTQQNNQGASTGTTGAPLLAGTDYQVRVPANQAALTGTTSTTNPTTLPTVTSAGVGTNDDGDSGVGTADAFANATTTANFTLGPSTSTAFNVADPTGVYPNSQGLANNGTSHKPNVDLGFVQPVYSLGNRVWFDANNDGLVDAAESGVDGVVVELLAETAPGSGTFAPTGTTLTTANGGYYRFDNLNAGNYRVRVNPSNFAAGGPLRGYFTSGTPTANANGDANNDNNGLAPAAGNYVGLGVTSGTVTLGGATPEPTNDNTEASGTATYNATNSNGTAAPDAQSNLSLDFGFHRVTIGNRVWLDTGAGANTNNGVFDAGESPVADGTVVTLVDNLGNVIATTTTTGGLYSFTTTTAGNPLLVSGSPADLAQQFRVVITPPAGLTSSTPTFPVATGNDERDHGAPTTTGGNVQSANFTFSGLGTTANGQVPTAATASTAQPQLDFGLVPTFSLGNRVWFDANNSGTVDGTEVGADGVTVELLVESAPGSGVFVSTPTPTTLTTANGGYYRFDGLTAGNYRVRVNASNFAAAGPLRGYFTSGTPTANADGDVNNDNNGLAPAGGNYVGLGVTSGTLALGGATPEPTNDNTEASGTASYNATNSNGTAAPDNQSNLSVDFGFHKISIGNRIWFDVGTGAGQTNNGILDAGETGVPDGTVVNLVDASGNVIATTTTTGGNGTYMFMTDTAGNALLSSGSPADIARQFRVVLPTPPSGAVSSSPDFPVAAGNDSRDHGAPGTGGAIQTPLFTVTPGATTNDQTVANATATTDQPQLDIGLVPQYSIGNRVWLDTNGDGIRQTTEPGRDGVVVNLQNSSGQPLYRTPTGAVTTVAAGNTPITTTTASGGYYRFDGLPPGDYIVQIAPSNFQTGGPLYSASTSAPLPSTTTNVGGVDGVDNNSNGVSNPTPGTNGISSGVVTLGNGGGNAEPTGETDLSPSGQGSADNRADMTVDFGFIPVTFALGNTVFIDTNNNGIRDTSGTPEAGLPGVTVNLYADANGDGVPDGPALQTTTTNGSGQYLFSGLPEGSYVVEITGAALAGYTSSTGINGGTTGPYEPGSGNFTATGNNLDHGRNVSPGVIRSGTVTLGAGMPTGEGGDLTVTDPNATPDNRTNLTVDFGVFQPASIGTVVWIDNGAGGGVAGDGIKQPGEPGIPGVTIILLDSTGNPVDGDPATPGVQQVTTVTGPNGQYQITNLTPGTYQVQFVFPPNSTVTLSPNPPGSGSPPTNPAPGGLDNQFNEMDPNTRRSPPITLAPGQDNPNLDSGVRSFAVAPPIDVPTLRDWMLWLLALLVFVTGAAVMRRSTR
jgi:SdrD B-like domain